MRSLFLNLLGIRMSFSNQNCPKALDTSEKPCQAAHIVDTPNYFTTQAHMLKEKIFVQTFRESIITVFFTWNLSW